MMIDRKLALLTALGMVLAASTVSAQVRYGSVYQSGQLVYRDAGHQVMQQGSERCDSEPGLVFDFAEQVEPEALVLEVGEQDSGTVSVMITITLACFPGQAVFSFRHQVQSGVPGEDFNAMPQAASLVVPLTAGASQSRQFSYEALRPAPRNDEFRLALVGDRITFFITMPDGGQSFGEIGGRPTLAIISVAGRRDVIDPGLLPDPDDERTGGSALTLNESCEQATPGSSLALTCEEIGQFATTGELRRRAAEAFDAHQVAALPAASGEGARIQLGNVAERIAALRQGMTAGVSLGGLSLSYGGHTISGDWLPVGLQAAAADGPGSTLFSDRWGAFVNGNVSFGDRSRRGNETGFDFRSWGLTAGLDYRFDNGAFAGAALGYSRYSADLDDRGGDLDADGYSLQLFGSWEFGDELFIDATLGHTWTGFDIDRVVDLSGIGALTRTVARGSTDARQLSASLSLNYRLRLEGAWTITPYGQYTYSRTSIDGFSESGSVFDFRYPDQRIHSRLWSVGARATRAINLDRGVMIPYLDLAWEHEGGIDGYFIQPVLVDSGLPGPLVGITDPDRNFGRLDAGFSWVFPTGNQLFLSYSALLFERDTNRHSLFFGLRWEF